MPADPGRLINYYEILGLSSGAGIVEIKAAFRQLAKQYHPDVNPNGKEHFTKILKAYETLSDPSLKSAYDYKLNYSQSQPQQKTNSGNTKTWRFDERELKRRQYYNDHIKKYEKQTQHFATGETLKKNYNEFKYMLFATPLAVILFLLIMSLANRELPKSTIGTPLETTVSGVEEGEIKKLKTGDVPYSTVFGYAKYSTSSKIKLTVKNFTGLDVIVCLFAKNSAPGKPDNFVRSFYLENSFSAEVFQLPDKPIYFLYQSGRHFDASKQLREPEVQGIFTEQLSFFKSKSPIQLNSINELTLLPGNNEGFDPIDEADFFKLREK
jgi:curved DNA-binding protein CbpA